MVGASPSYKSGCQQVGSGLFGSYNFGIPNPKVLRERIEPRQTAISQRPCLLGGRLSYLGKHVPGDSLCCARGLWHSSIRPWSHANACCGICVISLGNLSQDANPIDAIGACYASAGRVADVACSQRIGQLGRTASRFQLRSLACGSDPYLDGAH